VIPLWVICSAYFGWGLFLWLVLSWGVMHARPGRLAMPWPARIAWFLLATAGWPVLALLGLWVLIDRADG
jgi:hypothetical protein